MGTLILVEPAVACLVRPARRPFGCSTPETSAVSFRAGLNRANNALLSLSGGSAPALAVEAVLDAPGSVHFVVDIFAYFE